MSAGTNMPPSCSAPVAHITHLTDIVMTHGIMRNYKPLTRL